MPPLILISFSSEKKKSHLPSKTATIIKEKKGVKKEDGVEATARLIKQKKEYFHEFLKYPKQNVIVSVN